MVNYSSFAPFDKEDFHPYCEITDWLNLTDIEHCWLADSIVSLPDLDTDSTQVQDIWQTWISEMVANYSRGSFLFSQVPQIFIPAKIYRASRRECHSKLRRAKCSASLAQGPKLLLTLDQLTVCVLMQRSTSTTPFGPHFRPLPRFLPSAKCTIRTLS